MVRSLSAPTRSAASQQQLLGMVLLGRVQGSWQILEDVPDRVRLTQGDRSARGSVLHHGSAREHRCLKHLVTPLPRALLT